MKIVWFFDMVFIVLSFILFCDLYGIVLYFKINEFIDSKIINILIWNILYLLFFDILYIL